jgi:hypothetical protein
VSDRAALPELSGAVVPGSVSGKLAVHLLGASGVAAPSWPRDGRRSGMAGVHAGNGWMSNPGWAMSTMLGAGK